MIMTETEMHRTLMTPGQFYLIDMKIKILPYMFILIKKN